MDSREWSFLALAAIFDTGACTLDLMTLETRKEEFGCRFVTALLRKAQGRDTNCV